MRAISGNGDRRLDMRILRRIALLAGLFICFCAQAELINYEEAIEASDITVYARKSGNGYVEVKRCPTCNSVRLEITPASIISVGEKRVHSGKKISRHWPGGVVIYNVRTRRVVKLGL